MWPAEAERKRRGESKGATKSKSRGSKTRGGETVTFFFLQCAGRPPSCQLSQPPNSKFLFFLHFFSVRFGSHTERRQSLTPPSGSGASSAGRRSPWTRLRRCRAPGA